MGKGVCISIIDSGISARYPDFQKNNKSRVVAAVDFTRAGTDVNGNGFAIGDGLLVSDGIMLGDGIILGD